MKIALVKVCSIALIAGPCATMAHAQGSSPPSNSPSFFVAQKAWFVDWDIILIDSRFVAPSPSNPVPTLQTGTSKVSSSRAIPLTTFGVRLDRWTLSASVGPSTRFSNDEIDGGSVSRTEYDVNLSYALTPNIGLTLIYKGGKVDGRARANAVMPELFANRLSPRGVALGLSAATTVGDRVALYANAAYGPGRASTSGALPAVHARYSVGEFGVSYRFPPEAFGGIALQAGYRMQHFRFTDFPSSTYAASQPPVELSTTRGEVSSMSKGPILGLSLTF